MRVVDDAKFALNLLPILQGSLLFLETVFNSRQLRQDRSSSVAAVLELIGIIVEAYIWLCGDHPLSPLFFVLIPTYVGRKPPIILRQPAAAHALPVVVH